MNYKVIRNKLEEVINKSRGTRDDYAVKGCYGISYNEGLGYVSMYAYCKNSDNVEELFLDYSEVTEMLGKNFFNVTDDTKFKKVRNIIGEYIY